MVPEPLGGLVVDAFSELIEDDPDQFPRMEPRLEGFEAGDLLDHRCGDSGGWLFGDDLDIIQEQAEHALVLEAAAELPDSFRVSVRFVGALLGRTVFHEDQGPDEFIAPLDLIDNVQLQLRKVLCRFHGGSLHASVSCPPLGSQDGRRPASPYAGTLLLTRAHGPDLQGMGRR
jgi:hypothetical protein